MDRTFLPEIAQRVAGDLSYANELLLPRIDRAVLAHSYFRTFQSLSATCVHHGKRAVKGAVDASLRAFHAGEELSVKRLIRRG